MELNLDLLIFILALRYIDQLFWPTERIGSVGASQAVETMYMFVAKPNTDVQ